MAGTTKNPVISSSAEILRFAQNDIWSSPGGH